MKLDLFYYDLPRRFIAQKPLEKRDHARLLILDRSTGAIKHDIFNGLIKYLTPEDVLVLNETRVIKCRLTGEKISSGSSIECFILEKIDKNSCLCLLKPYRRLKVDDRISVGKEHITIYEKIGYGKAIVKLSCDTDRIISESGKVPLPPYIKNESIDDKFYQTIYAKDGFSAAGPTAGFHFTQELFDRLTKKGIVFAKLRLDIGLDTFRPIVEENIEEHVIHSERYLLKESEAEKILNCKKRGGRVIAVGTTTTRVLETVQGKYGTLKGSRGKTYLYIYPGYKFKIVDAMITNFHLPYSTLLVMVSAFAGRNNILEAYENAKRNDYRFYSFGDCMLII